MLFEPKKSKNSRVELNYLRSTKYWHRPAGGFMEIFVKMEEQKTHKLSELGKDYVELHVASLLGLGLQISEKKNIWISKPENDPPDFVLMTPIKDEKQRVTFAVREIEITRYIPEYTNKSLLETLLDKDALYSPDYIIVCLIEDTGVYDLQKLSEEIIAKTKYMRHFFLVFNGAHVPEGTTVEQLALTGTLVQVAPIFDRQSFNIIEEIDRWKKDNEKLMYLEGLKVFWGIREGDSYPNILDS